MMNPIVSVIIPCYNEPLLIEKAVTSVLNQTYSNKEIIVIDDGSGEETKEALKIIEGRITKLIIQENKGVIASRNNGIKIAKGEYIVTLDADDFLEADFIQKAVDFLEKNQTYGVVTSNYKVYNKSGLVRKVSLENKTTLNDFLLKNRIPSNAVFRKVCWEQCGGYDPLFFEGFEDWDFWINIASHGWKFKILDEFLLNIYIKDISRNRVAMKEDIELRKKMFSKYSDLYKDIFEDLINFQFDMMIQMRTTLRKRDVSLERKIGIYVLKPYRVFKNVFRK